MDSYHILGTQPGKLEEDRSWLSIELSTDKGPLTLTINAEHLESFVSRLADLEARLTILDPATGPKPGEPQQLRIRLVDQYRIANADVNGVPSVLVGVSSGAGLHYYALDAQKADAIQREIADEIPKLAKEGRRH